MPLGPKMKQSNWKNKRNAKFHPEQQFQGDAQNEQQDPLIHVSHPPPHPFKKGIKRIQTKLILGYKAEIKLVIGSLEQRA